MVKVWTKKNNEIREVTTYSRLADLYCQFQSVIIFQVINADSVSEVTACLN